MKPALKIAIVVGGYIFAFLAAAGAVALHSTVTRESNTPPSDGMAAFGDVILFVAVFGVVAVVPTGAAVFFLFFSRKNPNPLLDPAAPHRHG